MCSKSCKSAFVGDIEAQCEQKTPRIDFPTKPDSGWSLRAFLRTSLCGCVDAGLISTALALKQPRFLCRL